jgi:hypothetical protein
MLFFFFFFDNQKSKKSYYLLVAFYLYGKVRKVILLIWKSKKSYCEVGYLMYAMVYIRSDLVYAVNVVSKYMTNQERQHLDVVKWIFIYLKGTTEYDITFVI